MLVEYFKRLFNEMVVQSKQLVGSNARPINNGETEAERSVALDRAVSRELRELDSDNKSFSSEESLLNILDEEALYINRIMLRCRARKNIENDRKKRDNNRTDNEKKPEDDQCYNSGMCHCDNCSIISGINECGICLESLQNRGVRCCGICANIVCSICEKKLQKCPFCRTSERMHKNEAIERLLDRLFLPCRNARNGCEIMLNSHTRKKHENTCVYNLIKCPLGKGCGWSGTTPEVFSHLRKAHGLKPLEDRGLIVEISNFRRNTRSGEGEYTIYLICNGRLFTIKLMLRRRTLTLTFIEMGHINQEEEDRCQKNYGVHLNVNAGGRLFNGFMPILKYDDADRQIEIDCTTFPPTHGSKRSNDGTLKIEIGIKELNDESDE